MKQGVIIIVAAIFLLGCQPKSETEKETPDIKTNTDIEQHTESSPAVSEGGSETAQVTEVESNKAPDVTDDSAEWYKDISSILDSKILEDSEETIQILSEYGRLLSGSWTEYPDRVDGERDLSWGVVPYANFSYTLIDFVADQPVYIMGYSENGPVGFDNLVAKVRKIEMESSNTFRIHYVDDSSSFGIHRGEFIFHYDIEKDAILLTELGGRVIEPSSIDYFEYRVSERLPE